MLICEQISGSKWLIPTGQKSFRITKNEVKGMIDMARKDNKGRNLKTGEYQRPDGRYE